MDDRNISRSILNIRNLVILAIFGMMIWFVVIVREIIGIFLFSMVLAFLLYPWVERLCRIRIPRSVSVFIVYICIASIITLIGLLIVPPLIVQAENLVLYVMGENGSSKVVDRFSEWSTHFVESFNKRVGTNFKIDEIVVANQEKINNAVGEVLKRSKNLAGSVASFITMLVSIPVITFYLLMDWSKIKTSLMRLLPPHLTESTTDLTDHLTHRLNSYLRGQLKLSFLMFLITTSSLAFLNAIGAAFPGFGFHIGPFLLLGTLSGLVEVIPIVGPIIAFTPALILGFVDGPITGITVIILYGLIQFAEGNILVPRIMGNKLDVHPLTVMFALLCGGVLGGIGGMLLALPAAATLKVLFELYYPNFIKRVENLIMEQQREPATDDSCGFE